MAFIVAANDNEGPGQTPQRYCADIAQFLCINPDAWTQGMTASGGDGRPVAVRGPWARRFCALGLIEHFVERDIDRHRVAQLVMRAITPPGQPLRSVDRFNDQRERTVGDIIDMFSQASALTEDVPVSDPWFWQTHTVVAEGAPMAPMDSAGVALLSASILLDADDTIKVSPVLSAANDSDLMASMVPWSEIMEQLKASVAA